MHSNVILETRPISNLWKENKNKSKYCYPLMDNNNLGKKPY